MFVDILGPEAQLGAARSGGVERHQDGAMPQVSRGVGETGDFVRLSTMGTCRRSTLGSGGSSRWKDAEITRMSRAEFVRRLVLDKICDYDENLDQTILHDVNADAAECALIIERWEVVAALSDLITLGLARAYILSPSRPYETKLLDGMPNLDQVEQYFETYFLATEEGSDLQRTDDSWWPFKP